MRRIFSLAGLAVLIASVAFAQDIAGDWQGTLKAGPQQLRLILHVTRGDQGAWKAELYSIDQQPDPIPVSSLTVTKPESRTTAPDACALLQCSDLKFSVDAVRGSYQGTVNADATSIAGTWTQGQPLPLTFVRATKETAWQRDASPHTVQFVTVEENVKLEVLDWGGSGRPVVLLAGLGNSAHIFDKFAPKLTPKYHVYGITRRGFGASSAPVPDSSNYSADRLGDDVLAVCDSLKLNRPVLIGHSIAGEELSSIGSRHPEKVAGLVYLDAGYSYAYYDRERGDYLIDSLDLEKKLQELLPGKGAQDQKKLVQELLETDLPQFENDLRERQKDLEAMPAAQLAAQSGGIPVAAQAIMAGEKKYTDIRVYVLAIFAVPHDMRQIPGTDPKALAAAQARDAVTSGAHADAFQKGIPTARVVRLPNASHYVFFSNEADVLREIEAFVGGLR